MTSPPQRMTGLSAHFFASLRARIAELNTAGHDIIRLDEGAPDLPPAAHIIEALAHAAARPEVHSYQPHRGPAALHTGRRRSRSGPRTPARARRLAR